MGTLFSLSCVGEAVVGDAIWVGVGDLVLLVVSDGEIDHVIVISLSPNEAKYRANCGAHSDVKSFEVAL